MGDPVALSVTIEGASDRIGEPRLPGELMRDFEVYSSGTSRSMSLVGGQSSVSLEYRYVLQPRRAGTYEIGPVTVEVAGTQYRTQSFELEILAQSRSGSPGTGSAANAQLRLDMGVDKSRVVEGEEIVLSVYFRSRGRILDRPDYTPPNTQGFVVERLPEVAGRTEIVDGVAWSVQEIRYALFPLGNGSKVIGAPKVTATVPRQSRRRDPFSSLGSFFDGRSVTVEGEPITIDVMPLPLTTDPAFSGAVGQFELRAEIDRLDAVQNDPITLSISIRGVGNLGSAGEAESGEHPSFRTFDASSEMEPQVIGGRLGGVRSIQRVFVPQVAGDLEVPAVRFVYFDPDEGAYRTLVQGPFPVRVTASERADSGPVVVGRGEVRVLSEDVRYIHTAIPELHPVGVRGRSMGWTLHLVPALALGGAWFWRRREDRLSGDVRGQRRRGAARTAGSAVATAGSDPDRLWAAISTYLTDRLALDSQVLAVREAASAVDAAGWGDDLARRVSAFGEACDFERFAPGGASGGEGLAERARSLVDELERAAGTTDRAGGGA
jgi:hypothetical protein